MTDTENLMKRAEPVAVYLKAISNEKRFIILCALFEGREKSVGELENIVGLSQSALSQHLARLRKDGLVSTRREAQTIFYSIKDSYGIKDFMACLSKIFCESPTQS